MSGMQSWNPGFCMSQRGQSVSIFMKELFLDQWTALWGFSEVFLIIATLFSQHATKYQKFIESYFCSLFARPLIFSPAGLYLPAQTFIKVNRALQKLKLMVWDIEIKRKGTVNVTDVYYLKTFSPDIHVRLQQGVDAVHYPAEEASVQSLGHGVSDIRSFVHCVGADDGFPSGDHTLGGQSFLKLLRTNAEERGSWKKKSFFTVKWKVTLWKCNNRVCKSSHKETNIIKPRLSFSLWPKSSHMSFFNGDTIKLSCPWG